MKNIHKHKTESTKRVPRKILSTAQKIISGAIIAALFIGSVPVTTSAQTASDLNTLQNQIRSAGLPIGRITMHQTPGATASVIYFPQIHQDPSSSAGDAINNTAQTAQNQIYQIVSYMAKNGIMFNMAEGDLYGPVPADKVSILTGKINAEKDLSQAINTLSSLSSNGSIDPSMANQAISLGKQVLAKADRAIILDGGAYKYKAEGNNLTLYGAENKDTYEKSADLVRNYIYLQDRIQQLGGGAMGMYGGFVGTPTSLSMTNTQSSSPVQAFQSAISNLASQYPDNSELSTIASNVVNDIAAFNKVYVAPGTPTPPSRSNNPYANVTSMQTLQSYMSQAENQIEQVVINQRNAETAANMANGLKTENQSIGMLEFGADHESGLVQQLQKQGLNVLVVAPQAVQSGQSVQQNLQQSPVQYPQVQQIPQMNSYNPYANYPQQGYSQQPQNSAAAQYLQTLRNRIQSQPVQQQISPTQNNNVQVYSNIINYLRALGQRQG
jgi:hypothetical protein